MACMKCGKRTEEGQSFCVRCLEVMEAYPVKPDIHIQLPVRKQEDFHKKQNRKNRVSRKDSQIAGLRKQIRWMWVLVVLLALALSVSLFDEAVHPETKKPGQNYTYTEPTT